MTKKAVSFAMYRVPATAFEGFWHGLRRHLADAGFGEVEALESSQDVARHWTLPNLLIGQTCGYPLTRSLHGRVRLVGTPCYDADGCEGPLYSSLFVVRSDDPEQELAELRGRRAAINGLDSQSGYNALRAAVAPLARNGRFFADVVPSGAHLRSLAMIQTGEADIAAIDCVTYALASDDGATAGLRIIGRSPLVPGLPLITAASTSDDELVALRSAFAAACADPALASFRQAMRLSGFAVLPLSAYGVLVDMERAAVEAGYPVLA